MQERHIERYRYFQESARTCGKHYIPYIVQYLPAAADGFPEGFRVLEVGCGEAGNLAPFAQAGCIVTGVDMHVPRIEEAREFFEAEGLEGTFIASDIFELKDLEQSFDLIIVHDVIEHLDRKEQFMAGMKRYLAPGGVMFVAFPAWQMPFGGHQQMAKSKKVSKMPFIHLLPKGMYRGILRHAGESEGDIEWFMDTRRTRTTIEMFRRIAKRTKYTVAGKRLYFINPHYETKFGMRPRRLTPVIGVIPWLRNFFTTSCWWLLKADDGK